MQIFSTPSGPALKVRAEKRYGAKQPEHLFVLVQDRMILTRWEQEIPDEFKLIYDPTARVEADVAITEASSLVRERAILFDCLASALGRLDSRSAEQIRDIYREKMKGLDVVSLTKPSDVAT